MFVRLDETHACMHALFCVSCRRKIWDEAQTTSSNYAKNKLVKDPNSNVMEPQEEPDVDVVNEGKSYEGSECLTKQVPSQAITLAAA
jgi:hypothetical protein